MKRDYWKIIGNFVPNKPLRGRDSHDGIEGKVNVFEQHTPLP